MAVHLVFGRPRHAGGPVHLVFGGSGPVVVPDPVSAVATVELEDIAVTAQALYDNRMARYIGNPVHSSHQVAAPLRSRVQSAWGTSERRRSTTAVAWQPARAEEAPVASLWGRTLRAQASTESVWQLAAAVGRSTGSSMEIAARRRAAVASGWELAVGVGASSEVRFEVVERLRRIAASTWGVALPAGATWEDQHGRAQAMQWAGMSRWELARHAPQGRTPGPVPPLPPGARVPSTHLVFACPRWAGGPVHLVFGHVCNAVPALVAIPVRTYYMTINSIALRRVIGNVALPAHAFNMALDADSWTWSWSATLDRSTEAALQPVAGQPAELEAVINGVPYRLLVGRIARSKQFPSTRIQVFGRGLAGVLADPHAPVASYSSAVDLTAQQLMGQVLTVNGAPIGWDIAWGVTDWLVPGNTWTFQGTPIEALLDIAGAVGGYLQPHPTAQTLRVLPRYPTAPWEWGSVVPDLQLPASAVEVESMDWVDRPAYNGVFVGGIGAGVFGPVTRAGTTGDVLAPQVTHQLITHADAHRQRGLAELADTGRQVHMSLELPVLPETGLILPGKMVRYVADQTRVGIVRSVSLNWSSPVMRQKIGVESHDA